jgi:uncharacterized membrane protein YgcG
MRLPAARAIVCLVLPTLVAAVATPVGGRNEFINDAGGFFSAAALADAADVVRSIESFHGRDVRVETYAEVPADLKEDLERDGREKFYDEWLNRRAGQLGVRGVFVLVTRTPGRVQVGVDKSTRRHFFGADDRDALRDQLAAAFRAARYDQGLLDGMRFVRRRMDEHAAARNAPIAPVTGAWN